MQVGVIKQLTTKPALADPLADLDGTVTLKARKNSEELADYRRRLYRAILSIGAQPPVVNKGYPSQWPIGEIVQQTTDAYGYTHSKRRFQPTARDLSDMLPILDALSWHKAEAEHGERDVKIIMGRAYDTPFHVIADRLRISASERSLRRWEENAILEIMKKRLPLVDIRGGHIN